MPLNSPRPLNSARAPWRLKLHEVIFEAETPLGKVFDIGLLIAIILSVVAVVLESVADIRLRHGPELRATEWFFTTSSSSVRRSCSALR